MSITIKVYNKNFLQENTYVVSDDATGKIAVIDPGCYPDKMKEELKSSPGVDYIILTHGHGDHIACVPELKNDYPDAKIVANFDEQEMITSSNINESHRIIRKVVEFDADIYVTDNETLTMGETEFTFITTPGHTKGGMCILTDGILFSGDTLFKGSIGRTDFYGGDMNAICSSITDKLFKLTDDTKVLTGHGPATTIGYEKRSNPFV